MQKLDQLKQQFAIAGAITFEEGNGNLPRITVATPLARAEIYLHGGHVTAFTPAGEKPLLYLSPNSKFSAGAAIRGGIPIIFPWFGPREGHPESLAHGFARTLPWDVVSTALREEGVVEIVLRLTATEATLAAWPDAFVLMYTLRIGRTLDAALRVQNAGNTGFSFEEALHTYLAVGDVRQAKIAGLENTRYLDKVEHFVEKTEGQHPIAIAGETDRVYLDTTAEITVADPANDRSILVRKRNSHATVLWNPWMKKAAELKDLGESEYPKMLCVETCNVGKYAVTLSPGQGHSMSMNLGVAPAK